jgi:8-hydroxy-5-deazaflavin:NADPH oxidoreductase
MPVSVTVENTGPSHWLEGASLLSVGVGRYGVGDFNFSLGVNFG